MPSKRTLSPHRGDPSLGWARVIPDRAYAKQEGTWKIVYHAGAETLARGARVWVYPPVVTSFRFVGTAATTSACIRWDLGTLSVATDADAALSVNLRDLQDDMDYRLTPHYTTDIIEIVVEDGAVRGGQTMTLTLGDQNCGGRPARAQWMSGPDMEFLVAVDVKGDDRFRAVADFPRLTVYGHTAERLVCLGPSCVTAGEPFEMKLKAEDAYTNISGLFDFDVCFRYDEGMLGPARVSLAPWQRGQTTVRECRVAEPGTYRAYLSNRGLIPESLSAPVSTEFTKPGEKLYWGEIHAHTELSDGVGDENRYYDYARDEAWLDFAAIGDHGMWWTSRHREAARRFHQPGSFVTLLGFEGKQRRLEDGPEREELHGHINLYSSGLEPDRPADRDYSAEEIKELVRSGQVLLIPHHSNDRLAACINAVINWDRLDPDLVRVAEICQMRGSFEHDEVGRDHVMFGGHGCSLQDGLARGFRFGFVGGTDNHCGRAGSPMETLFVSKPKMGSGEMCRMDSARIERTWCGLTAVLAPALTREAVFKALWDRRCYATTGARMLVDFGVNDLRMGQEGRVSGVACVKVRVAGTAPIRAVTIVRNNEDVHRVAGDGLDQDVVWEDAGVKPGTWYYPRIEQEDGHFAWASPVWCD